MYELGAERASRPAYSRRDWVFALGPGEGENTTELLLRLLREREREVTTPAPCSRLVTENKDEQDRRCPCRLGRRRPRRRRGRRSPRAH